MSGIEAGLSTIDIETIVGEATRRVVEAANPEKIILFGSYARGDITEDSDLDLLAIPPNVEDRITETICLKKILTSLRCPADVMMCSSGDVAERGNLPGGALRWTLEEGKILYAVG